MAAAQVEYVGTLGEGVESFGGGPIRRDEHGNWQERERTRKERVRLSAREAEPIRYVFCDWTSEAGVGSSAAQLERLAALPELLAPAPGDDRAAARRMERAMDRDWEKAWRRAWEKDAQVIIAHGSPPAFRDTYSAVERWTDSMLHGGASTKEGIRRHRCHRALRRLAGARSLSLVVLHALYGDRLPGTFDGMVDGKYAWGEDLTPDYVRVLRFVDGSGSAAELEARLRIDKRRRPGETESQWRANLLIAQSARAGVIERLGKACEKLIEAAALDYRGAWEQTP